MSLKVICLDELTEMKRVRLASTVLQLKVIYMDVSSVTEGNIFG